MRFISPIERYRLVAVHQKIEVLASGLPRVLQEGFTAEFNPGDTTDWERDLARKHFKFRNIKLNQDGSEVDPINRVSSFDTASIKDPSLRKKVEDAMLANADFGQQEGFLLAEKPKLAAPWPSYDELKPHGQLTAEKVAKRNLETAAATGTPLDQVIAYERQERNNEKVLAVYEEALAEQNRPEPDEILVEA